MTRHLLSKNLEREMIFLNNLKIIIFIKFIFEFEKISFILKALKISTKIKKISYYATVFLCFEKIAIFEIFSFEVYFSFRKRSLIVNSLFEIRGYLSNNPFLNKIR